MIKIENFEFDASDVELRSVFKIKSTVGVSYDIRTGKYWAINGLNENKQRLKQFCNHSKKDITSITSTNMDNIVLSCLTSGISGVYSIELNAYKYGILDTSSGMFIKKGSLPIISGDEMFNAYVFAQDSRGNLHYINGDGVYFTKRANEKRFKQEDVTFPQFEAYCGDFIDDDTIIAVGSNGDFVQYSISKATATSKVIETGAIITDVTNGALPRVCPAQSITAVSNNLILEIGTSSVQPSSNYNLDANIVGITHHPSKGVTYALTSNNNQALVQLCKSSHASVTNISPSTVNLVCLTSGKKGIFAINIKSKTYGKLSTNTGSFKSKGNLPDLRTKYVFAQDNDGVLHYISSDGKHYDTSKDNKLQPSGIIFDKVGKCGEFDANDIIAPADNGGTIRYSLIKSIAYAQLDKTRTFNDVTINSITSHDSVCSQINKASKGTKSSKKSSKKSKSSKASISLENIGTDEIRHLTVPY